MKKLILATVAAMMIAAGCTSIHSAKVNAGDIASNGEAVAVGMLLAVELSARRGLVPVSEVAGLRALLQATGLPTEPPADMTAANFLELMARDKKVVDGRLRLVLLEAIGTACIVDDADERELVDLLETPANG